MIEPLTIEVANETSGSRRVSTVNTAVRHAGRAVDGGRVNEDNDGVKFRKMSRSRRRREQRRRHAQNDTGSRSFFRSETGELGLPCHYLPIRIPRSILSMPTSVAIRIEENFIVIYDAGVTHSPITVSTSIDRTSQFQTLTGQAATNSTSDALRSIQAYPAGMESSENSQDEMRVWHAGVVAEWASRSDHSIPPLLDLAD